MTESPRVRLRHIAGALAWGAFFSVAPIHEVIEVGAVIWIPLLLFCEWRRSRRFGFLPGAAIRVLIVAGVVSAAIHAPLKYVDRTVGPFPDETVEIENLETALRAQGIPARVYRGDEDKPVALPTHPVTVRELLASIEAQTGLLSRIAYCGTGKTLLFGLHPITVSFTTETSLIRDGPG